MFVCFDVHTHYRAQPRFPSCVHVRFFFYSYMLHRIRAYIYRCETRVNREEGEERERERRKKSNTSIKPRSLSLCVYVYVYFPLYSTSPSFSRHRYRLDILDEKRITTIECNLISSMVAN